MLRDTPEIPVQDIGTVEDTADTDESRDAQVKHLANVLAQMEEEREPSLTTSRAVNPNVPDPKSIHVVKPSKEVEEAYQYRNAMLAARRQQEDAQNAQKQAKKVSSRVGRFVGGFKKAFMKTVVVLSSVLGGH